MKTFKAYINYGCLTAEKRKVWTAEQKSETAVCADEVEITIPEGWQLYETETGETAVEAPWGWKYELNEILVGNEEPYFYAINGEKETRVKLTYKIV